MWRRYPALSINHFKPFSPLTSGPSSALSLELAEAIAASYLEWARDDPRRYLKEAVTKAQSVYLRYGIGLLFTRCGPRNTHVC